jgi:hypothetical protein
VGGGAGGSSTSCVPSAPCSPSCAVRCSTRRATSPRHGPDAALADRLADRGRALRCPEGLAPSEAAHARGAWRAPAPLLDALEAARAATIGYARTSAEPLRAHAAPHPDLGLGARWVASGCSSSPAHADRHAPQLWALADRSVASPPDAAARRRAPRPTVESVNWLDATRCAVPLASPAAAPHCRPVGGRGACATAGPRRGHVAPERGGAAAHTGRRLACTASG